MFLFYCPEVQFCKKYFAIGSAPPEVDLRFCPWLLLSKYWTDGPDPSSSLCLHYRHWVDKAFSLVVRIGNHPPLTRMRGSPPLVPWWGYTFACGRGGGGGPNSDEGSDTVVLYVYMDFVTFFWPKASWHLCFDARWRMRPQRRGPPTSGWSTSVFFIMQIKLLKNSLQDCKLLTLKNWTPCTV
jgi:hypothetical protein